MPCQRETCELVATHRKRSISRWRHLSREVALLGAFLAAGAWPSRVVHADTAARRPMTVEDLWAVKRVGAPAVSPDGRWVAFTVTSYSMENNKGQGDLWLLDTTQKAEPRRLTTNEGPDSSPRWSPDGKRLAYVSKRGEDPAQLYLLSMSGGEPERVTELPVAVSDPRWFSDGKRLVFLASTWPDLNDDFAAVRKRLDEQKQDKTRAQRSESRLWRYWDHPLTDGTIPHIFVIDLESRKITDLLSGSARQMDLDDPAGTWDIAPDGSEIAFSANVTEAPHRTLDVDVLVVSTSGGEARRLTADNPADDVRPRYTPDGRFIVFGRARRPEIDPDFTHLASYERKTGTIRMLSPGWDAQPSGWTCGLDGKTLYFHSVSQGRSNLYALGIGGGTPRLLVRGGNTGNVAVAPGGKLYFTYDTLTQPAEIWSAKSDGSGAQALTSFNAELMASLELGSVRDVTFAGAGGDPVQMFVVLPPNAVNGTPLPLLQVIHGGPHGSWLDQFHYRWNAALLASRGFLVALVNFHGSTGSGQAFCESILGAHGDKPFTDIMQSTDWLIAQGLVDSTRMAAAGGSYGGYLVDWILGHSDRFKALVSHAGVYDLMGQFASDSHWGRANNYGALPWEDPQRIDLWSPNQYAANFRTPTLVLHGEKDYRVPVTQGIELYGVLTAKGVPARLVVFPDENHWIVKPQASRLWHQELFAWVEKHTGVAPSGASANPAGAAPQN
ncbi:MAG TPA: S9 family peptidase [Candidatus Krumholzibacteria bacterium]|nr:S9 family peptidase [Candidatus Krumholzibacteria bacterium]